MSKRSYVLLFLGSLLVYSIVASFQSSPGYMDADYYFGGGLRLAEGKGFSEDVIWNYLDDPSGLPTPSHLYWMPLASILSWIGIKLLPLSSAFKSAQIIFILIASLVPLVTAKMAFDFSSDRRNAILAGLLAIFSGFYVVFLTTTDTFGIYLFLGGLFCWLVGVDQQNLQPKWWLLGLISGVMHLSRADGVLWLVIGLGASYLNVDEISAGNRKSRVIRAFSVVGGYIIVMIPWFVRNFLAINQLMPTGGSRAFWINEYNELFSYPASILTFDHWLAQGLETITSGILDAIWQNLQSLLAVQGSIFLFPLVILGAWSLRNRIEIKVAAIGWLLTFITMTFVFPITGVRGGFFHSGAATQTVMWTLVPIGLNNFVNWGVKKRHWVSTEATNVFSIALIMATISYSSFMIYQKVIGVEENDHPWDQQAEKYMSLDSYLVEHGAIDSDIVMIINPPGYYVSNARGAIVTPNGSLETIVEVAARYGVEYLLVEIDHTSGLDELYNAPHTQDGIIYLGEYNETHVYKFYEQYP